MSGLDRRIESVIDGLSAVCAKQCEGGSAEVRPETSSAHHHDMTIVEAQTEGGIAPTDAAQVLEELRRMRMRFSSDFHLFLLDFRCFSPLALIIYLALSSGSAALLR